LWGSLAIGPRAGRPAPARAPPHDGRRERGVVERGARGEEEDGGIGVGDRSVRVWVQIAQHEIAEISPEQLL